MHNREEREKKMENEFNGFSLFNDVEDVFLQSYNRCVIMFNISSLHGDAMAEDYAKSLDDRGRSEMLAMYYYITETGMDEVKRQINSGELEIKNQVDVAMEEKFGATVN